MADTNNTERVAFEAWYCDQMRAAGFNADEGIAHLREGDHYGERRVMLNGKWDGWQARASMAAEPNAALLDAAVRKLHAAKGRYHTQLACCDLYDLLGLPNVRPGQDLESQPNAALADGWVSVDERLPEPGKPVLLDIGKGVPLRALWAAKHTVEARDDDTDWAEYSEADDMYYCPEGWYEWNRHEDTHWAVSEKAVAWMEMPAPPTLNASKEPQP